MCYVGIVLGLSHPNGRIVVIAIRTVLEWPLMGVPQLPTLIAENQDNEEKNLNLDM